MKTTIKKGLRNVTRKKTTSKQRTALGLKETTKPYGKSSTVCSASQLVASSYASGSSCTMSHQVTFLLGPSHPELRQ